MSAVSDVVKAGGDGPAPIQKNYQGKLQKKKMQKKLLAAAGDEPEEPSSAPTSAKKITKKKIAKTTKKKSPRQGPTSRRASSSAPTSAKKSHKKYQKSQKLQKNLSAVAGDEPEGFVFSADECRRAFDLLDRVRARPDKKGCVHTDWRMRISRARCSFGRVCATGWGCAPARPGEKGMRARVD